MKEKFLNIHTYVQVCGTYSVIQMWNLAVSYVYWAGSLAQHHACIQQIEHISSLLGVYNFRCWSLSYVNWRIRYDNTYWIVRTRMYVTWIRWMNTIKSVWSKSEWQIFYINTCIWNLKLCTHETIFRAAMETETQRQTWGHGQEEGGTDREHSMAICTLPYVEERALGICCVTQGTQPRAMWQPRGVGWGGGGREALEGGDICVPMADSCWYMAETTTIL